MPLDRDRLRKVGVLALPIVGGMISQNILNLVDTAMVGTLGDAALAAVGLGGFVNFTSQAVIQGLSAGVQTMAARRHGEGRHDEAALPLNGGLLLALAYALPVSALLFWLAPTFYPWLNPDPAVIEAGVPYYRARVLGIAAVGMNFAFRGYWNGVSLSRVYLRTLVVMHLCNVFLNYALIFGRFGFPELGATGAGIGTTVSTFVGTAMYVWMARSHARGAGFMRAAPGADACRRLLRLSIPNGVQQVAFAAGLTALFWIVGRVGTTELAAANVLINLMLVAILPALGLGLAATSLVGQALGRRDVEDARRWAWDVVVVALVVLTSIGLPYLLVPDVFLRAFLHDPGTLAVARVPLQIVGATIGVEAVGLVMLHALIGAGDTRTAAAVMIGTQWGVFLPVAYLLGPVLGHGLVAIWIAQSGYRALMATLLVRPWRRGAWARIEV